MTELLVSWSSWWRLMSSHSALTPATSSTNTSAAVLPNPPYGLTVLHQHSPACGSGRCHTLC